MMVLTTGWAILLHAGNASVSFSSRRFFSSAYAYLYTTFHFGENRRD